MIMFRIHYANNTSLDVSAASAEAARAHGERFVKTVGGKRYGVTKVKRLKEQPTCPPFNSSFSSAPTASRSSRD